MKQIFIRLALAGLALTALAGLASCKRAGVSSDGTVELVWYQVGDTQKDADMVLQKVNEYTKEKLGVTLKIYYINWSDYSDKMKIIINTGDRWDLAFTCSWTNDYLPNAQRGAFLALNDLLPQYAPELYAQTDPRFWEAAKIKGTIYAVPHEKEIGSLPMWVFTKEYVDKYNIPYQDLHTLEDLEPWLQLIKEREPGVVPLYLTRDYSVPIYMDRILNPLGIEYGDESLTVKNQFDTDLVRESLNTMRRYFLTGYVNKDASTTTDDRSVKRFVTKGDGQPFAELIWGKDLGYEVVATQIMDTQVTNFSARGAMTGINKNSAYPEKSLQLLNLINTDEYLRNLLNYGIEGVHWERVPASDEEKAAAAGRPYVYDSKVRFIEGKSRDYSVPYWVQGGLFTTYVAENEPLDKWATFKDFNDAAENAPTFGFDFDIDPVATQAAGFASAMAGYGSSLHTGSVDPVANVAELNKKLEATGMQQVIDEMQRQIDAWRQTK